MPVHVSIHDVSPVWSCEVERALGLCEEHGAVPSLLVVPDFHGHGPLGGDEPFCRRLRDLQRRGHEIHLHGLRHLADPLPARSSLRQRFDWIVAQRLVSAGEAEMADLPEAQGRARIAEGESILAAAGLHPRGYVAPAWAMPPWMLRVLAERGYGYTEDHLRVYAPRSGRSRPSVVLNWASRTRLRLASSALWSRVARPARALVPVRIAIHPADMCIAFLVREVRGALGWARGDFVPSASELLD